MDSDDKKWYVLGGIVPPDYVKQPVLAGPFATMGEAKDFVLQAPPGTFTNWIISKHSGHLQPGDSLDVLAEVTAFMKAKHPELEELVRERLNSPGRPKK